MSRIRGSFCIAVAIAALAACGSNSTTSSVATGTARGTLIENPPFRIASLNAAAFEAQLDASPVGQSLLALAGAPACGVDFYYVKYWTVGAAAESATASGALMVPTGAAPQCSGPRPIVLYAHGTNTDKALNIADVTNSSNTEGQLIADHPRRIDERGDQAEGSRAAPDRSPRRRRGRCVRRGRPQATKRRRRRR